jgi:multidrug efflux pump
VFYVTVRRLLGDELDEVTQKLRHEGSADAQSNA